MFPSHRGSSALVGSTKAASAVRAVFVAMLMFAVAVNAQCSCNNTVTWSALQDLYTSTAGPRWARNDRWLEPGSSVCDWYGMQCGALTLSRNNLAGTLPPSLGNITTWTIVVLAHNPITGSLPPEYSTWTSVQNFTVINCSISGTLPAEWSVWPRIQWFYVSHNSLTGTLPPEFSAWSSISVFFADTNQLTGTLPAAYRVWRNIDRFVVASNFITGTLPPEYSAWGSVFTQLEVFNNSLTGTLPPEYGNFTNLLHFYAEKNRFTGTLPPSYANWKTAVRGVTLQRNALTGTLPPEYESWTEILHFYVGDNRLYGVLPVEYKAWTAIVAFGCYSNQFSGTLPPEYSAWTRVSLYLLSSNLLDGTLPPSYGKLPQLASLVFDNNRLIGTIPLAWTGKLMGAVALHNNWGLHGTIPTGMSIPIAVSLCNTSICGSLPASWTATTLFCQAITDEDRQALERFDISVLTPVAKKIPSCTAAPPPATTAAPTTTAASSPPVTAAVDPVLRAGSGVTTTVFVWAATFAGLSPSPGSGLSVGPALHVSSAVASIAAKLEHLVCDEGAAAGSDASNNNDAVGSFVGDNPTTVRLPGRLSLAGGTVVGNAVLLCFAPPVLASFAVGIRRLRKKAPVHPQHEIVLLSVRAHVAIAGFLVVPTIAAAAVLLLDGAQGGGGAAPAVLGVFGLVVVSATVVLGLAAWRAHYPLPSAGARASPPRRRAASRQRWSSAWRPLLADVVRVALAKRAPWQPVAAARESARRVGPVGALLFAFLEESVLAAAYPHAYAFAVDFVFAVLQGLVLGVAASPLTLSCDVVRALLWTSAAASAAATAYEAAVRPRAMLFDQAVGVIMGVWTTVTGVLAAVGDADAAAAMTTAQSVVALVVLMAQTAGRVALPGSAFPPRPRGRPPQVSTPTTPGAAAGTRGEAHPPSRAARELLRNLLGDRARHEGGGTRRQSPFDTAATIDAICAQQILPSDVLGALLWVICDNNTQAVAAATALPTTAARSLPLREGRPL